MNVVYKSLLNIMRNALENVNHAIVHNDDYFVNGNIRVR